MLCCSLTGVVLQHLKLSSETVNFHWQVVWLHLAVSLKKTGRRTQLAANQIPIICQRHSQDSARFSFFLLLRLIKTSGFFLRSCSQSSPTSSLLLPTSAFYFNQTAAAPSNSCSKWKLRTSNARCAECNASLGRPAVDAQLSCWNGLKLFRTTAKKIYPKKIKSSGNIFETNIKVRIARSRTHARTRTDSCKFKGALQTRASGSEGESQGSR